MQYIIIGATFNKQICFSLWAYNHWLHGYLCYREECLLIRYSNHVPC